MTVFDGSDLGVDERRDLLRSSALFADLTLEQLDEVVSRCDVRSVPAGEWCIRCGEPSDGLYIVAYGRLLAYVGGERGDEISQGQVFGEVGMLARTARTADVRAVRDTELLFLPATEFDRLADEHPGWLRRVARVVVDRLAVPRHRRAGDPVRTITVVPVGEVGSLREVTSALRSSLEEDGKSIVVDRGAAPPLSDRARWAQRLEDAHRYVVFDGVSDEDDTWSEWCNRHSDRLVLVADATSARPLIAPPIARELPERIRAGTVVLVLLQPPRTARPRPAHEHRRAVGDAPVLNVRRGHVGDLARMSRLVAGRGCGLVLGGGGPRGFAHLGVMRALDEAGVPVDAIGGTSIGAVMGAFRALDLDADTRERWALSGFVESGNLFPPTFPILSYSSARKVRELLESDQYLGDRTVEETWIPFFCVSANLTRAEVVVHERGPLATAVRASLSLPGIFPPVRSGSDFLVDGGVLNNLPVDIMRHHFRAGSIVAVDLSVGEEVGATPTYLETPSGWSLLFKRLAKRQDVGAMPLSLNVLMRARELAGIRAQRQILAEWPPDLLIRPDVARTSMFDFKGALHLIDVGRRAALAALETGGWPPIPRDGTVLP
jgi:predicted acylesterase/phospholipase RssA/CRP-like cAMP-binding protein